MTMTFFSMFGDITNKYLHFIARVECGKEDLVSFYLKAHAEYSQPHKG